MGHVATMGQESILGMFEPEKRPVALMLVMFIGTILVSLFLIQLYPSQYRVFGSDTNNPVNPLLYIVMIVIFTFLLLFIVKKGFIGFIRIVILLAVATTIVYVMYPIYYYVAPFYYSSDEIYTTYVDLPFTLAFFTSYVLTLLTVFRPEWYVVNFVGFLMSAGVIAIFGISFGVLPALVLLMALALYDAWAVYWRKHMIDLADTITELHLPMMMVSPKTEEYSYEKETGLKKKLDAGEEREAMFMGLGDIVIPGVLVAVAAASLPATPIFGIPSNIITAIGTLIGGVSGFLVLMTFVLKGRPQAGLPLLNGGTIAGYVLTYLLVYHDLTLGIRFPWW
jgi:presenilin-like A22 family membrane protease